MSPATVIRMFAVLVFTLGLFGFEAQAQNPFRPAPPAASPPAAVPEEPSMFEILMARAITFQRGMVRDIGRHMADIRDGNGKWALWLGVGFAFLYGALHTLGPGHGKMIVASYFVGREAQIWRGLLMGTQIAVTHVISAIAIVWLVDITFRQFLGGQPAESVWIRILSFGLIAAIGATMLVRAIRHTFFGRAIPAMHRHDDNCGAHASHDGRQQGALALLAGLVPCTGAILVMLFALANGIVAAGVLMVVAISAGMAITMAVIGMGAILFRRIMLLATTANSRRQFAVAATLEHVGAILILAVGLSFLAAAIGERLT